MSQIITALKGKKTYILAVGGAVTTVLYLLGQLDRDQWEILMSLFGFSTAMAMRAGMSQ